MDFMKVIDQTVREIKREVNLKVLKVPEIEQKGGFPKYEKQTKFSCAGGYSPTSPI
uniref:Uncharacterized protein n=1 Tax=Helianthus annuus TaxID=4232 RepID=A0A251SKM2_HELAN